MNLSYKKNLLTCLDIVEQVLKQKKSLAHVLQSHRHSPNNQNFNILHTICNGTVRQYPYLNSWLNSVTKLKPKDIKLRILILCALYQCHFMEKKNIKSIIYSAVESCIDIKREWAKPIVKAVLERSLRESLDKKQTPASQQRLPDWLYTRIQRTYQTEEQEKIINAWNHEPQYVGIRSNSPKRSTTDYQDILDKHKIAQYGIEHWSKAILVAKKDITKLPLLEQSEVYIQDPVNQYLVASIPQLPNRAQVLDACGAPGGKSGALLNLQPNIHITLLDKNERKIAQTQENLQHYRDNISILHADALATDIWWDNKPYDAILLDVPCSATANIGQFPEIKLNRTPEEIQNLQNQQKNLCQKTWTLLKHGGYLLYSTCSLLREENEELLDKALSHMPGSEIIPIYNPQNGLLSHKGVILLPDNYTRGGYFALLQKKPEKTVDNNKEKDGTK